MSKKNDLSPHLEKSLVPQEEQGARQNGVEELHPHALVHAPDPVFSTHPGQDVNGARPASQHLPHYTSAPGPCRCSPVARRVQVRVISLSSTAPLLPMGPAPPRPNTTGFAFEGEGARENVDTQQYGGGLLAGRGRVKDTHTKSEVRSTQQDNPTSTPGKVRNSDGWRRR